MRRRLVLRRDAEPLVCLREALEQLIEHAVQLLDRNVTLRPRAEEEACACPRGTNWDLALVRRFADLQELQTSEAAHLGIMSRSAGRAGGREWECQVLHRRTGTKPDSSPCFADLPLMLSPFPTPTPNHILRIASELVGRKTEKVLSAANPVTQPGRLAMPGWCHSGYCDVHFFGLINGT